MLLLCLGSDFGPVVAQINTSCQPSLRRAPLSWSRWCGPSECNSRTAVSKARVILRLTPSTPRLFRLSACRMSSADQGLHMSRREPGSSPFLASCFFFERDYSIGTASPRNGRHSVSGGEPWLLGHTMATRSGGPAIVSPGLRVDERPLAHERAEALRVGQRKSHHS